MIGTYMSVYFADKMCFYMFGETASGIGFLLINRFLIFLMVTGWFFLKGATRYAILER